MSFCPRNDIADVASKCAAAISFMYLSGSVVMNLPRDFLGRQYGFSQSTKLSFKRPVSEALTKTWVGISTLLRFVVIGKTNTFGL